MAQVTDVIITGKGEPSLYLCGSAVNNIMDTFREWPMVLQTNGKRLNGNSFMVSDLAREGLNVLAVSIDEMEQMRSYAPLWEAVRMASPLTARITVMLTKEACGHTFEEWVTAAVENNIRGLSFREITVPTDCEGHSRALATAKWIREVEDDESVKRWIKLFDEKFRMGDTLRRLPYGAVIKDFKGVSVTKFDYCIQDSSGDHDIRSLVYNQDGHLYTSWSSPASLIF